jgi:FtsP/CotA-like multicopper oxidase with cupredoxin domain
VGDLVRPRHKATLAASILISSVLAVGLTAPIDGSHPSAFTRPLLIPRVLTGSNITLTAAERDVQILPGAKTRMWTYNGTFPGPTIRRPAGQTTTVTLVNELPVAAGEITLHNHGNHSTTENDGQPDAFLAASGGGSVTYTYTGTEAGGNERGAFQWYHDHRMDVTGRNIWMGLVGMYIIDDPADPQTLPKGEFDVPLLIADRSFNAKNQLTYRFNPAGVTGNHILVNGVPQPYFKVGDRKYRLRILNASNSRSYDLALSTGQSFIQIGTESGLLPAPVRRTRILIGPAERVDVVIDFAKRLNQKIVLQNLAATGSLRQLMQFRVTRDLTDRSSIPSKLRPLPSLDATSAVTRTFEFGRERIGGRWTINGQVFDPERIDAQPRLGTTETWILKNKSGSSHVIHIHDVDQQLVSRDGVAPARFELMKESWLLGIGETVVVKLKFTDNLGRFVFHCHILEHEDAAMMAQMEVIP